MRSWKGVTRLGFCPQPILLSGSPNPPLRGDWFIVHVLIFGNLLLFDFNWIWRILESIIFKLFYGFTVLCKRCVFGSYYLWSWFSFFDRFVRFVSTPAVLERFVSLEKEIQQIESQFQANALSMSVTTPEEGMVKSCNLIHVLLMLL